MKKVLMFSQLSPPRQTLVRICQALNFGSILNVGVTNGEVNFDPQPDVIIDVQLDGDPASRAELELDDFSLRPEVSRLFVQIDALKNGTIDRIVVHGGIPRRVILRRPLSDGSR